MKRKQYNENRAELDQEAYRDGFLDGYENGVTAAIEYLQIGYFTYEDHGDPVCPDPLFGPKKLKTQKFAYEIGYNDAFDRGYQDTLKAVDCAFKQIRGISITDSFEIAGD